MNDSYAASNSSGLYRVRGASATALMGMASVALAPRDIVTAERLLDEATSALQQAGPWFLNLPLYIRANLAVQRGQATRPSSTSATV